MVISLITCGKPVDKTNGIKPNAVAGATESDKTTPILENVSDITPDVLAKDPENKAPDSDDDLINPREIMW